MDDDWSKIVPLTEDNAMIAVKSFFVKCGLDPRVIDHTKNEEGHQSPDLVVYKNSNPYFYCEIKTPGHYLDEVTNLYLWEDVYNRLRDRLRKARKQLESYDPGHILPRIVAFTSNHPQLNYSHCQHNIVGVVGFKDTMLQDFRSRPEFKFTEKNKRLIDMILWCQVNRLTNEIFETNHFLNSQSKHFVNIKDTSNLLPLHRRYVFEY